MFNFIYYNKQNIFKYGIHVHEWCEDVNFIYKKIKTGCILDNEHSGNISDLLNAQMTNRHCYLTLCLISE